LALDSPEQCCGVYGHALRRIWSDGISRRVEGQVPKILAEAAAHAAAIKEDEEKRERIRIAFEQDEQRRAREQLEEAREKQRGEFLTECADTFDEAERLARFLGVIRRKSRGDRSDKMCEFLKWAASHVADLRESCSASAIDAELAEGELW
jgi:hypothetical protein